MNALSLFLAQLRHELIKLFGKKRTYIGFIMFLIAQNAILLIFRFSRASASVVRALENNGYDAEPFLSNLTMATIMVFPITYMLLPLYVALTGGDFVAKEVEDGTLRMILARPISRWRLLALKWLSGVIFSVLLIVSLGVFGLLFSSIWFKGGSLFVFIPGEVFSLFDGQAGLRRYILAHGVMVLKAITIMGCAFMFSCFNVKPAAATILALSFFFVNFILMNIPFFKDLQHWFLTYHLNIWQQIFAQEIFWWKIAESLSILLGFNLSFLVIGGAVFHARDIKT